MVNQKPKGQVLVINLKKDAKVLKGLASEIRINILDLLRENSKNVNEIASILNLPQSTVATNVMILEKAGLIKTVNKKASRGSEKKCHLIYDEFVLMFSDPKKEENNNVIEVEMPIGLFIQYDISPPCGMCSSEQIIGYLDSISSFLEPDRGKAGLLWFEKGFVEYQFPNNALIKKKELKKIEIIAELSSEVPGTNPNWPSDITMWINNTEIGMWTSPGDFGDRRGLFTPDWWKLEGSQYGIEKHWSVTKEGSFINGAKISNIKLKDLNLMDHHSIRIKIGIKKNAKNIGGVNIFGSDFGDYNHGILLRMYFD
jgi:predicted transcriptional regulator